MIMLRFLYSVVKKAPLFTAILLVWLILTVLAITGRGRAYKNYASDYGRHPLVSVVMRGIHDHVMPWTDTPDTVQTASADEMDNPEEKENDEADSSPDSGKAGSEESPDASAEKEIESAAPGEGTDGSADVKDTKDDGAEKPAETDEKKGDEKSSGSKEKDSKDTGSEEAAKSLVVPATSCSKVVPAKDYGVAQDRYLSPKGTVYNKDTKGLFAPNGTYYPLQEVDKSYFEDALFVGDSRTVGLLDYGGMESFTSFLARESTTVYDLLSDTEKMEYCPKGKKMSERTLKDLLTKAKFRKIYLSVGVNELGIPDTLDFYKEFRKVVREINKMQPEAIIYIQGIMHVSEYKSKKDPVFNNTAIVQRNQAIATLANGRNIFYIDMNGDLCDQNGNLKDDLTGDGIHLKASACSLWYNFLKKNAIVIPD